MYLPPHTALSLASLQDLLSRLPVPLILLEDFSAHHHLWGIIDKDERDIDL
jgi:hypothetical protein